MNSELSIKPMTPQHLDAVAAIEKNAGAVRWTRGQFEKELSLPMSRFFVLEKGSNILGYGGYWKVSDEAQITNLAIHPDERRKGLGRKLLEQILQSAGAEGCRHITLEVRSQNNAAQTLYQKLGFVVQGRRPHVYAEPKDDAVLMGKVL